MKKIDLWFEKHWKFKKLAPIAFGIGILAGIIDSWMDSIL